MDLPTHAKAKAQRDPLDYDPTPPDSTHPFIASEIDHIRRHGDTIWEPAVGNGHIARVLKQWGFRVRGGDIVDRGYSAPFCLGSFYETQHAASKIKITNPPYGEINARDGHGRWLNHCMKLQIPYVAMLLNADWPAARKNGMDALLDRFPPSIEYICCWKIDFRGLGSPPQRNSWFVWDVNRPAIGPSSWVRKRLYKDFADPDQTGFDVDYK